MSAITGDLKIYQSDENGNIDLLNEWEDLSGIFDPVLPIAGDVSIPLHVKNTNTEYSIYDIKIWSVAGGEYTNTSGTPVSGLKIYDDIPAGEYTLTFPTANSVVATGPNGVPLIAQSIVADSDTYYNIKLYGNLTVSIQFATGLQAGNTAKINISDANDFLLLAEDNAGVPDTFEKRNSYDGGLDIGTLQPEETYKFWIKQSIPTGTSSIGNNRQYRLPCFGSAI